MSPLSAWIVCLALFIMSSSGNNENLSVTQSPPSITVQRGGSADMQCCWGGHLSLSQVRVKWKRKNASDAIILVMLKENNKTEVSIKYDKNKYNFSASGNCSILTISTVSADDTGVYICVISIEIPQLLQSDGSGTHLTVQEPSDTNQVTSGRENLALSYTVRCFPFLILVAIFCYYRRKKARRALTHRAINTCGEEEETTVWHPVNLENNIVTIEMETIGGPTL